MTTLVFLFILSSQILSNFSMPQCGARKSRLSVE